MIGEDHWIRVRRWIETARRLRPLGPCRRTRDVTLSGTTITVGRDEPIGARHAGTVLATRTASQSGIASRRRIRIAVARCAGMQTRDTADAAMRCTCIEIDARA